MATNQMVLYLKLPSTPILSKVFKEIMKVKWDINIMDLGGYGKDYFMFKLTQSLGMFFNYDDFLYKSKRLKAFFFLFLFKYLHQLDLQ